MFFKKNMIAGLILCFFAMPIMAWAEDGYLYVDDAKPYDYKLWERNGRYEQKINEAGFRLLNANKFPRNVRFVLKKSDNINASAKYLDGSIVINSGMLPYIENDDELAAILSHELGHIQQLSTGNWAWKRTKMLFAPKYYKFDADIKGVDYMMQAGYNPLAMITVFNKASGDDSKFFKVVKFLSSPIISIGYVPIAIIPMDRHPWTSKRMAKIYNHILINYPKFITEGYSNPYYANFLMNAEKNVDIRIIKDKHDL